MIEFEVIEGNLELPTDWLDEAGRLRLMPAAKFDAVPHESLRVWCNRKARYGLVTQELVDWLKPRIEGKRAIEIGAGHGDLAYHLGIPATDSRIQEDPDVAMQYAFLRQPMIEYPPWVEKYEAHLAVAHYKPEIVLASWVTQFSDQPDDEVGSPFGVHESLILSTGCCYVLLGNERIHGAKRIMAQEHVVIRLPGLRSRSRYPEADRLYIWNPCFPVTK